MLKLETNIISNKGSQAPTNQDYITEIQTSQGHLWIVADGEGDRGVKASRVMTDSLRQYVEDHLANNAIELLRKALVYTNEILHKQMLPVEGVVAIQEEKQIHLAVFGKSKALKGQNKQLEDINSSNGVLGQQAVLQPQIVSISLEHGSQAILMTKGAFLQLNYEQIAQTLFSGKTLEAKNQELIQKTLQAGGQYNASIALIEHPSINISENVGKAWKGIRPFAIPGAIIAILAAFFITAHYTQKNEKQEEEDEQTKALRERQLVERRKDSLAKLDVKKDTVIAHKLEKGETVGIVARKYNSTNENLMELNLLDDKASVARGQILRVNVKMIHVVEKDQTLQQIYDDRFKRWDKLGVTVESIVKANKPANLAGKLKKGTKIIIPALKKDK